MIEIIYSPFYLTAIFEWSAHWQLSLSPSKCSVLHVPSVRVSFYCNYHINDVILLHVDSVTDLGVTFDSKLGYVSHIGKIISKASLRSKLLAKAFCTYVRPTLEYCSVVWSPALKKDIYRLEAVQRRFTERLTVLRNIPYCDRLACLNLDSFFNTLLRVVYCCVISFWLVMLMLMSHVYLHGLWRCYERK